MNLSEKLSRFKLKVTLSFLVLLTIPLIFLYVFFKIGVVTSTLDFFVGVLSHNYRRTVSDNGLANGGKESFNEDLTKYSKNDVDSIENISAVIKKYEKGALTETEISVYKESLFYDIGKVVSKDDIAGEVLLEIFYSPDTSLIGKSKKQGINFDISNTSFVYNTIMSSVFEDSLDSTEYGDQPDINDKTKIQEDFPATCMFGEFFVRDLNASMMNKLFPCLRKGDIMAVLNKDYSSANGLIWEYVYYVN